MNIETVPKIDPKHLTIFYIVANEKNLTSAAEKLNLTQPAITYHIKILEEYTRVKLIDFRRQQVCLTVAGEGVFKYAKEIYQQLVNTERFIKLLKDSTLRVGIDYIYVSMFNRLLKSFSDERYPKIKLTIRTRSTFGLVQDVLDSELDVAIIPQTDDDNEKLKYVTVSAPQKIICIASPRTAIAQEPIEWKDIVNYPLVIGTETSAIRRIIVNKIKKKGFKEELQIAAEIGSPYWAKKLVENDLGLGFTIADYIEKEVTEGLLRIVPLKEDAWITAHAIMRSDTFTYPIINRFISLVKQAFNFTASHK